ncbi:Uncharacterised protein [Mycobacteroides abscessus]|nr:Uncharacterised protein [Mycobacteroides abscessus]
MGTPRCIARIPPWSRRPTYAVPGSSSTASKSSRRGPSIVPVPRRTPSTYSRSPGPCGQKRSSSNRSASARTSLPSASGSWL